METGSLADRQPQPFMNQKSSGSRNREDVRKRDAMLLERS